MMLKNDIIEPSTSDWASPIVLIRKKDNSIQLCVDYQKVNIISKMDAYSCTHTCKPVLCCCAPTM